MVSSEVQRTLVKSPPELWAELSDAESLARHLGALGDVRITRVEPERRVEWEAGDTSGAVEIKASGWGTKVTLTATRAEAQAAQDVAVESDAEEPEPTAVEEATAAAAVEPEPKQAEPEPEPTSQAQDPDPAIDAEPRRRGFLARLFGWRHRPAPGATFDAEAAVAEGTVAGVEGQEPATVVDPATPEEPASVVDAATAEEPAPDTMAPAEEDAAPDLAAELQAAEDVAADEVLAAEVTAVLTAALDRLGAAHHRPFSRA